MRLLLASPAIRSECRLACVIIPKSTLVEVAFCDQGLLAAFEFVKVVGYAIEEVFDFGADFGK